MFSNTPAAARGTGLAWLLLSLLVATVPAAGQVPIPGFELWQTQMIAYGQPDCDYLAQAHTPDDALNHVYYDAERVFYQIADYTGNATWTTCAQRAEASIVIGTCSPTTAACQATGTSPTA